MRLIIAVFIPIVLLGMSLIMPAAQTAWRPTASALRLASAASAQPNNTVWG